MPVIRDTRKAYDYITAVVDICSFGELSIDGRAQSFVRDFHSNRRICVGLKKVLIHGRLFAMLSAQSSFLSPIICNVPTSGVVSFYTCPFQDVKLIMFGDIYVRTSSHFDISLQF